MRVFVDFDGVLRRESSPRSALDADCIEHFAGAVLSHPEAKVVISSTWRLAYSLAALRRLFPPELAERIEGATPEELEAEEHARQVEIQSYLNRNGLHGMRWIAVDDDEEQFREGAPLLVVDPVRGFDAACAARLRQWLAGD
jgi:hypothetical protein